MQSYFQLEISRYLGYICFESISGAREQASSLFEPERLEFEFWMPISCLNWVLGREVGDHHKCTGLEQGLSENKGCLGWATWTGYSSPENKPSNGLLGEGVSCDIILLNVKINELQRERSTWPQLSFLYFFPSSRHLPPHSVPRLELQQMLLLGNYLSFLNGENKTVYGIWRWWEPNKCKDTHRTLQTMPKK